MKNNISKYDLISSLIALINAEEYESTITNISCTLKLPVQYVRKTMITLLNNQMLQSCITTQEDYTTEDDEESFIERFLDDPVAETNKIKAGAYDDVIWDIHLDILDHNAQEILPLTHLEYSALRSLGENILSLKRASIFEKKDTINPTSAAVKKYKELIQDAIYLHKAICFNYQKFNTTTKQFEPKPVTCFPQELITNITDNWIYMRSTDLKLYRLDRIVQTCRIINNSPPFPGLSEDPKQKYVWGAFSNRETIPVHVKLRIAPETTNIVAKIRRDTAFRKETSNFYQEGDFYYYEDDIIGLDEFQRWIRGYGSSIVVMEPQSLRDIIKQRAKQSIDLYEAAQSWGSL